MVVSLRSNTHLRRMVNSSLQPRLAQVVDIVIFQGLILQGHPFLLGLQRETRTNPHDFYRLSSRLLLAAQFTKGNGLPNMGPHNMRVAYEVRLEDGNRLRVSPHQNVGNAYVKFVQAPIARIEAFDLLGERDSFLWFP